MFVIERSTRPPTGSEGPREKFAVLGATGADQAAAKRAIALGVVLREHR